MRRRRSGRSSTRTSTRPGGPCWSAGAPWTNWQELRAPPARCPIAGSARGRSQMVQGCRSGLCEDQ
eukprot:5712282-Pyramimonas_sp.AAC.1